jgi:glycine/D-amino acid oxidase-like deaminating enzyme
MTSLWLTRAAAVPDDVLDPDEPLDDLVVGAGLTGLTTALLLARAGRRVAVVEARTVGAAATGNSTAKLSLLQGTRLSRILRHQSEHVGRAYVEANTEGAQWLLRFCDDHGVDVQRRPAITYAADRSEVTKVRHEHDAATRLGLEVTWRDDLETPFPSYGGTVLADQAQFDPMDVLHALVAQLRGHGGTLHQGRRVVAISHDAAPSARLDDGTRLRSENVVLATGSPILDRGLYWAKLEPQRSYALAYEPGHVAVPDGMYVSAGSDSRSVRGTPDDGRNLLLVGGSGHTVGRTRSERAHVDALREWTARHFPGSTEVYQWSAQDYASHDGIPHMGAMPRGRGHIYVATGYEKWGMSNAVAASRAIAGQILDSPPSWSRTLGRRVTRPSGAATLLHTNARVGTALAAGALRAAAHSAPDHPSEGTGSVGRDLPLPTGRATTDGDTCAVVGLCTHLGGVLKRNDADQSWDCPLHGSRFAADGSVLEGPATKPLRRRDGVD